MLRVDAGLKVNRVLVCVSCCVVWSMTPGCSNQGPHENGMPITLLFPADASALPQPGLQKVRVAEFLHRILEQPMEAIQKAKFKDFCAMLDWCYIVSEVLECSLPDTRIGL